MSLPYPTSKKNGCPHKNWLLMNALRQTGVKVLLVIVDRQCNVMVLGSVVPFFIIIFGE